MIYFMEGLEDYKRDLKIKELSADGSPLVYDTWDARAEDAWCSDSLFGKKSVLLALDKLEADPELERTILKETSDNDLIVSVHTASQNLRIYKLLCKRGTHIRCDKLNEADLENHVKKGLKCLHASMTGGAYQLFITRTGYYEKNEITLYTVNTYLRQLACSTDQITENIVNAITPKFLDEDVMQLSVLLFSQQAEAFMRLVSELLEAKHEPIAMLGLLLRHFRIAYKAALYRDKEDRDLAKLLGLNFRQMNSVKGVRACSEQQIKEGIEILQGAAYDIKSGRIPGPVAFTIAAGKLVNTVLPGRIVG